MQKQPQRQHDASQRPEIFTAVLEAAAGGRRHTFEALDRSVRMRAIDLLESLGYIEVHETAGDELPDVRITSLGTLKLLDLRHANEHGR